MSVFFMSVKGQGTIINVMKTFLKYFCLQYTILSDHLLFCRVFDSEYSSRFKFVNGTWIESPEFQGQPNPVSLIF